MKPYEYDQPGCDVQMTITPTLAGDARVSILSGHPAVYIDISPAAVLGAALALYEAAGLPEPLILPRPEFTAGIEYAGSTDRYAYTSRTGAKAAVGWRGIEPVELDPDEALEFAAHITVNALAAKAGEPDPAEVEELAGVIHEANGNRGFAGAGEWDRGVARAALRWMRERETSQ